MRALSHMRPPAGAELRVRGVCGLCCLCWCVDGGRAAQWRCWGYLYAPRVTLLLCIRSDSRATVYRLHQQTNVSGMNRNDE